MNDNDDSFDELMRRALRDEAGRVEPSDALPEIRARAHAQRRPASRRPWLLTAGVAALGTAAAIGAFAVFTGGDNTANDGDAVAGPGTTTSAASEVPPSQTPSKATPSPVPSQGPTMAPTVKATQPTDRGAPEQSVPSAVVPVYWLGANVGGAQTKKEVRLYRTWTKVSGKPAVEALRVMTQKRPGDPDYYSAWSGAQVNSVTRADDLVTVDFKQLPQTRLDSDVANVAAQQLVYTIQGAMKDAGGTRVQVTEQGHTGSKLFGQVDTSQPLDRAQAADVQAFIWVTAPDDDAVVSSPLKVTGVASVFEAQLNWRIVSEKTRAVLAKGTANTSEAYKFAPFAFSVTKLPPGTYTLEVFEASAVDGSMTSTDSKLLTVK
ncbi:Gmad2 immunoglobulin-like domain-containing protein [Kribbella kalugense]|uniref:Sporulation and spore germination protein n=1 Tax=Kribbella kalugense TaxID=2512221 RepID=A0A4R8A113_9ACTN|nr:Gmad2 immunoglobulin-like domain-containing protein [Kribbella kalugense]TDW23846.1 sporulation and spore germination protein [Kribbella kalugense]